MESVRRLLFTFVSPEYAAKPVKPLDPQAALAAVNAFRTANGLGPLVLDERLSRAAAMQSEAQAGQSRRSLRARRVDRQGAGAARRLSCHDRLGERRLRAEILQRRDAFLGGEPGHRANLLRPNVTAIGVALAKNESGRPYWTLVLGAE